MIFFDFCLAITQLSALFQLPHARGFPLPLQVIGASSAYATRATTKALPTPFLEFFDLQLWLGTVARRLRRIETFKHGYQLVEVNYLNRSSLVAWLTWFAEVPCPSNAECEFLAGGVRCAIGYAGVSNCTKVLDPVGSDCPFQLWVLDRVPWGWFGGWQFVLGLREAEILGYQSVSCFCRLDWAHCNFNSVVFSYHDSICLRGQIFRLNCANGIIRISEAFFGRAKDDNSYCIGNQGVA